MTIRIGALVLDIKTSAMGEQLVVAAREGGARLDRREVEDLRDACDRFLSGERL